MHRLVLSASALCLLLSAAATAAPQGVGLARLGAESRGGAGGALSTARPLSSIAALAARPTVRLSAAAAGHEAMAGAAIAHGGRDAATALPVSLRGVDLMLSVVEVNARPIAVLRLPQGQRGRLIASAGPIAAAVMPRVTGCLTAGPAVVRSRPRDAAGIAVPLDCR
ncbi:hypothetical protein [Pseudodonghicola flavimaris]|uniref:Uncharacterized protein n=1 Tax=Pseudodonghicola flavimaris TaxID=3050036 RepID=A0ABT7F0W0_9RHOB|nr:hypothetical protein [Pseudodonghicola flavimaris]MDK3018140.1 hypothetical protein [Pseudodonghicola flavimaris]